MVELGSILLLTGVLTFNLLLFKFALQSIVVSSIVIFDNFKNLLRGRQGVFLYHQDLCFLEFDSPLFAASHKK